MNDEPKKEPKKKLIPELRFPEFQNDPEWEEKTLGEVISAENSQLSQNKLHFVSEGYPVYGADGLLGYIESFNQKEDYIAIIKDGSGVGRVGIYKGQTSILSTLTALKSKNNSLYNLTWLYYLLQTFNFSPHIKGTGIPHIYYSDYSKELVPIPSLAEQTKIADCLSSMDALISADSDRLKYLKKYKKGLLQQLFPAEGQTIPELRFPEFRDSPEWEEKILGEVLNYERPDKYIVRNTNYISEGVPVLTANKSFILWIHQRRF